MGQRMTKEEKSNLKLLRILKGNKLGLYEEVQEWRRESAEECADSRWKQKKPMSGAAAIGNIMKLYGYQHLKP